MYIACVQADVCDCVFKPIHNHLHCRQRSTLIKTTKTHHLDAGPDEDKYNLFTMTSSTNKPLTVLLTLNGANLIMEIDTGAARSVISDKMFTQLWSKDLQPPLKPTNAILKTYTGENIKPLDVISVQVEVNNQKQQLELLVVVVAEGRIVL